MYRFIRTEGSITRTEAIKIASGLTEFADDYYMGICWRNRYGLNEYLGFDEMTGDELAIISKHIGDEDEPDR